MKPTLASLFPNASQSCRDANQPLYPDDATKTHPIGIWGAAKAKRGVMNKTEAEFALMLEAQKCLGEILRYEPFGITLRWKSGDDFIKYTPDFVVIIPTDFYIDGVMITRTKLIEVKGAFIKGNRERAVERFRHARTYWREFAFEMHQKTKQGWKRKF